MDTPTPPRALDAALDRQRRHRFEDVLRPVRPNRIALDEDQLSAAPAGMLISNPEVLARVVWAVRMVWARDLEDASLLANARKSLDILVRKYPESQAAMRRISRSLSRPTAL